ncbi:unnamed protein product [Somion occarium]|uniref:Uncharacterized protein n=1 Tax=Somion occarium TaxID=3059160 RepID=A0ABP1CND0_9APHY
MPSRSLTCNVLVLWSTSTVERTVKMKLAISSLMLCQAVHPIAVLTNNPLHQWYKTRPSVSTVLHRSIFVLVISALATFTVAAPVVVAPGCAGQKLENGNGNCTPCLGIATCAYDVANMQCVNKPGGALPATLTTDKTRCPTLSQIAQENPSVADRQKAAAEFARMKNHIFVGESDPSSGRHTFTAFRAANKDAGRCDKETNLCAFKLTAQTPKTVWDDRAGKYTKQDVEDICTTAITLNLLHNNKAASPGSFAVQTKFGKSICVQHFVTKSNTPSCFPLGIHHATQFPVGKPCTFTGNDANTLTVEVPQGTS